MWTNESFGSLYEADPGRFFSALSAVERQMLHPDQHTEIERALGAFFTRCASVLDLLVERLASVGYEFRNPVPVSAIGDLESELEVYRIATGHAPPLAHELFWRTVGQVDLTGRPPMVVELEWLPDPLCVVPPVESVRNVQEVTWTEGDVTVTSNPWVTISPDHWTKSEYSGGNDISYRLGTTRLDPELHWVQTGRPSFGTYLWTALQCNGFPGYQRVAKVDLPAWLSRVGHPASIDL